MPKFLIDVDEIDLQFDEPLWLNVGNYKVLVQGNGRIAIIQRNQILVEQTIEQLVKAADESRNSGN